MSKMKVSLIALVFLLANLVCFTPTSAGSTTEKESQFADRVKASIAKLGTGPEAHVELKLRDGTKLKGYVAEIGVDHFVVADAKTGATTAVPTRRLRKSKAIIYPVCRLPSWSLLRWLL